jgi:hypothetical protein
MLVSGWEHRALQRLRLLKTRRDPLRHHFLGKSGNLELRRSGCSLNPEKSKCVSLVASGREKKVKSVTTPTFRASGSWLDQVDETTLWKYLEFKFRGCGSDDVAECLGRLTRAPLKRQQRMHLLRFFILPKFYYVWTFGRFNPGVVWTFVFGMPSGHVCA